MTTTRRGDGILDPFAIERAIQGSGCPVTLTTDERHHAVRILNARGITDRDIADRCGVNPETIRRDRALLGLPPAHVNRRGDLS